MLLLNKSEQYPSHYMLGNFNVFPEVCVRVSIY